MMNEESELNTNPIDEWESLERQLRSLAPRDTTFQLPFGNLNPPSQVHLRDLDSRSRSKRAWVATLIASWSMGAAAGIVGTLFYSHYAANLNEPNVAAEIDSIVNGQQRDASKDFEQENALPFGIVGNSPSIANREESQRERFTSTLPWSMPWSFLTRESGQVNSPQSILTPRNFAIDTQAFVTHHSSSVPSDTRVDSTDPILALPAYQNIETPLSQRDLTRILLEI